MTNINDALIEMVQRIDEKMDRVTESLADLRVDNAHKPSFEQVEEIVTKAVENCPERRAHQRRGEDSGTHRRLTVGVSALSVDMIVKLALGAITVASVALAILRSNIGP